MDLSRHCYATFSGDLPYQLDLFQIYDLFSGLISHHIFVTPNLAMTKQLASKVPLRGVKTGRGARFSSWFLPHTFTHGNRVGCDFYAFTMHGWDPSAKHGKFLSLDLVAL